MHADTARLDLHIHAVQKGVDPVGKVGSAFDSCTQATVGTPLPCQLLFYHTGISKLQKRSRSFLFRLTTRVPVSTQLQ